MTEARADRPRALAAARRAPARARRRSAASLVHFLTAGPKPGTWTDTRCGWRAAAFLAAGGIVFAFSLERLRWPWSALFAAAAGLVVGLVAWWNGQPDIGARARAGSFASALLAVAIAVPLFQAVARRRRPPPRSTAAVHAHAWTDLDPLVRRLGLRRAPPSCSPCCSAELFHLIGIICPRATCSRRLASWRCWSAARSAARSGCSATATRSLGTAPEGRHGRSSRCSRPILALGLVLFVLALPFTGLEPLWEPDQGDDADPARLHPRRRRPRQRRRSASGGGGRSALAASALGRDGARPRSMLPLAIVAAVSTGKRIGQYGFTPDRLWAAVFVAVAVAVAAAYLFALIRGRPRLAGAASPRQCPARRRHLPARPVPGPADRQLRRHLDPRPARPARIGQDRARPVRLGGDALRFRPGRPQGARAARRQLGSRASGTLRRGALRGDATAGRDELDDAAASAASAAGPSSSVTPAGRRCGPTPCST